MPIERLHPNPLEWGLLLPSLAALYFSLKRGLSPEPPEPPPGRWSPLHLFVVVFLAILMNGLGPAVLALTDLSFLPRSWGMGAAVLLSEAATVLAVLLALRMSRQSGEVLGLKLPRQPRNALAVILACAAFLVPLSFVAWAWMNLLYALGHQPVEQPPLELYRQARAAGDWVGTAAIGLGAVVAAPVAEELLFRGFIYGVLRTRMGWWSAALLTSAAFSAFHVLPEVVLPIFLVGLVLNVVYVRTGCLAYPMLFHALFNGTTLLNACTGG